MMTSTTSNRKRISGSPSRAQPGQTAARNPFLLVAINRFERPAEIFPRPRFHLDENQGVAVAADNVDLAAGASAKITIENFVAVPPQKPAGQFLPARAKPKMRGTRRRKPAAPPVRKIGDESDRARVHAVYQMQFGAVAFVLAEAIFGKARAEVAHNRVARDLRDHARGGDAEAVAIAIDDRGLRQGERENGKAVDEDMIGLKSPEPASAMRIASWVARRILIRSISIESTMPTAQTIRVVRRQFVIDLFPQFGREAAWNRSASGAEIFPGE